MSHIDSYEHEIVGLLGCIPVHHPLEDIPEPNEDGDADFGCTTEQLMIGGGSGEHPGLILLSAESAVAEFVYECGDFELSDDLKSHLSDIIGLPPYFNFAGWSTEDHHSFYEFCSNESLPNSFDAESERSLESWLHLGFGEFIYYAMPQLADELVTKVNPHHTSPHHIRYNNITLIPPGMPVYANGGNRFFRSPATQNNLAGTQV